MKTATMSKCKDPQNRSKKNCTCGGHSASDHKKNKHHHSTKNKLKIRKARQLSNSKNNLKVPKRGDTIYVDSSCSISHGSTDVEGGRATVTDVEKMGDTIFVSVKEHPGKGYNWESLAKRQVELKKEFGQKIAHPSPDIDTPWIEDGDIVDGHMYHGAPQW